MKYKYFVTVPKYIFQVFVLECFLFLTAFHFYNLRLYTNVGAYFSCDWKNTLVAFVFFTSTVQSSLRIICHYEWGRCLKWNHLNYAEVQFSVKVGNIFQKNWFIILISEKKVHLRNICKGFLVIGFILRWKWSSQGNWDASKHLQDRKNKPTCPDSTTFTCISETFQRFLISVWSNQCIYLYLENFFKYKYSFFSLE